MTLTVIAAKVYNTQLPNRIQLEIEKILRENHNGFRRYRSTVFQIQKSVESSKEYERRITRQHYFFVDFSKAFNFIHRVKFEQILRQYGIPKKLLLR